MPQRIPYTPPRPTDRPFGKEERERQLRRKQQPEVEPTDQMRMIRFDPTFMKAADKRFAWRGVSAVVTALVFTQIPVLIGNVILKELFVKPEALWEVVITAAVMMLPFCVLFGWIFKTDASRFTHFPIWLNRKTRRAFAAATPGLALAALAW